MDQYQGHHSDGSSIQNHSAGSAYPFIMAVRENAEAGTGYAYVMDSLGQDLGGYTYPLGDEQARLTAYEDALILADAWATLEVNRKRRAAEAELNLLRAVRGDGVLA